LNISQVVPNSLNPTLKQPLKINGFGFGNNISSLSVFLEKEGGSKNYRLKILKLINDTAIEVGFPGALAGMYKIKAKRVDLGGVTLSRPTATAADVVKVGVFINAVIASFGSPYGGTVLTIMG
jgi:hypothetical protein